MEHRGRFAFTCGYTSVCDLSSCWHTLSFDFEFATYQSLLCRYQHSSVNYLAVPYVGAQRWEARRHGQQRPLRRMYD
jgi:hypothetical protein